jgi:hypothetical protein
LQFHVSQRSPALVFQKRIPGFRIRVPPIRPKTPVTETTEPFVPLEEHILILVQGLKDIGEKGVDPVDFIFGT